MLVDSNEELALMDHHMLSISSGMKVDQNIYQGFNILTTIEAGLCIHIY